MAQGLSPLKFIAVGNTGAGKSTFGNCLLGPDSLGQIRFRAGVLPDGVGLSPVTLKVESDSAGRYHYVEIPVGQLGEAAAVQELAMEEDIDTSILLFVRSNGDSILDHCMEELAKVVRCLGDNLQEDKYAIIFNQFSPELYKEILAKADKLNMWVNDFWARMKVHVGEMPPTRHVTVCPITVSLHGKDNGLFPLSKETMKFVTNVTPVRRATISNVMNFGGPFAAQLAPQLATQLSPQLVPQFAPRLAAQLAPQLAPQVATQLHLNLHLNLHIQCLSAQNVQEKIRPRRKLDGQLENKHGKVLSSQGSSNKGTRLCVWDYLGELGQTWKVEGEFLVNGHGLCAAVSQNRETKGASICQWTKEENEKGQQWELKWLVPDEDYFLLRNGNGYYLSTDGDSSDCGAEICVWTKTSEDGQRWRFV